MTAPGQERSKGRILIIDDTPASLKVLVAVLNERGYRIHAATEGMLALRFLQSAIPDVILMDIRMPGMDGYEVCSRLKEDQRTRDIPVIFISGIDQVFDKVKAFQCGGVDYIAKPFEPAEALARIETQIALRQLRVGLEEEVRQRTADLVAANARLQEEIAERKQAQEALHQSEQKYRSFFEHNLAGNYISSPDGRLLACNPVFTRMFGFASEEEAMQTSVASLYSSPEKQEEFLQQVKQHGHVEYYEKEFRRQDGSPLYVTENAIGTFSESGELSEVHGFLIDETERRKTEQQLRQAQKLEAIGTLAGGVAHDFNNILGVIIGHGQLLLEQPEIGSTARRRAQEILNAGRRAASLTRQLLAFSRKQELQPAVLNLNRVIEDVDKMIRRLIGDNIEVRTLLATDLENVNADPGQMEQVILNFCVNARDAMPEGGRIIIETHNVEVDELLAKQHFPMQPGRYVQLAVSDSGIGMDKQTLSQVFEPFFTTKGPEKGTGLGLATVYGIVRQSGGNVWANSEPGQGSTFSVYLPVVIKDAQPRKPKSEALDIMRGSETILLVEDAAPLRALIRELLEGLGYTVLEAEDDAQAHQIADRCKDIALLLTDISLPRTSGLTMAKSLLEKRPRLKVLYMSAHFRGVVDRWVRQAGTDFLQKPFTQEALAQKLRSLLDSDIVSDRIA
jgi:PAS domain S-box-containing protein